MIAEQPYEPYIYIGEIKRDAGVLIRWLEKGSEVNDAWMLYADFEREKLKCLHGLIALGCGLEDCGYFFKPDGYAGPCYNSGELIGYQFGNWFADSESSRLLKRAEFLKAVCEKEGVEWLAKDDSPSQLIIDAAKETAKVMSLARGETNAPAPIRAMWAAPAIVMKASNERTGLG